MYFKIVRIANTKRPKLYLIIMLYVGVGVISTLKYNQRTVKWVILTHFGLIPNIEIKIIKLIPALLARAVVPSRLIKLSFILQFSF